MPAACAVIVLSIAACHRAPVHGPAEGQLEAVRFEGNRSIGDAELRSALALPRIARRRWSVDPYLVAVDRDRIRGIYLRRGYFDVDVRSRTERDGFSTVVVYTIVEGPRSITRIVITGLPADPALTFDTVREELPLQNGQPFDYAAYDEAKVALLAVLEDAGYAHAVLDARVVGEHATHEAVVELALDAGPRCRFGTISVVGVSPRLEAVARSRLAIAPGDRYSAAALARTQRALDDLRRFSMVRVVPDTSSRSETIDVEIALAASAAHEVSLGGGFSIDPVAYEAHGRADYKVLGWPEPLTDLDLDLRPGYAKLRDGGYEPRLSARATSTRMDVFRPFVTADVEGGYDYYAVEAYTMYGPRASIGLSSPVWGDRVLLRVGWMLQYSQFTHVSPLIDPELEHALGLDRSELLGAFTQALVLDARDTPLATRRGLYVNVRAAEGTPYAAGRLSFVQLTPDVRGFVPVGRFVLAARARFGAFFGDVPVSERYYAGGATSQRGFAERQLAPTVFGVVDGEMESVPIGGAWLVDTSAEVRATVASVEGIPVGAVVFVDGANVTETAGELTSAGLHWAIGGGVRLMTQIGVVRFDVGWRLDKTGPARPEPESDYAFHLTIGEAY